MLLLSHNLRWPQFPRRYDPSTRVAQPLTSSASDSSMRLETHQESDETVRRNESATTQFALRDSPRSMDANCRCVEARALFQSSDRVHRRATRSARLVTC